MPRPIPKDNRTSYFDAVTLPGSGQVDFDFRFPGADQVQFALQETTGVTYDVWAYFRDPNFTEFIANQQPVSAGTNKAEGQIACHSAWITFRVENNDTTDGTLYLVLNIY